MDIHDYEKKWQDEWEKAGIFNSEPNNKKKFFMIFAYPGISGYLHVGHLRSYTYPDVIARYKRMRGYNVLFPAGFHASGLPSVGFAKKVERKNKEWLDYLKKNGCPEDIIPKLKDPKFVVEYFSKIYPEIYWKGFGYSIDTRRVMSTIDVGYNKFIQWQFRKLMEKNHLIQKPHYAPFCPSCGPIAVDASETDISKGGGSSVLEFTLLKFKFGDYILPAATLRPETIYGVTNMWLNPKIKYKIVEVGKEKWIMSKEAYEKFVFQKPGIKILGDFKGSFFGKKCINPETKEEIPIFPGDFVDGNVATGVVMGVPAHAPYDWMALKDLKKDKKYGAAAKKIHVFSIIDVKGFDDLPAKEICEQMKIKNQKDKKLEEATEEVYKKEFHSGKMNEKCGRYEGTQIVRVKEGLIDDFEQKNIADRFYAFSEEVVCRCGSNVVIKIIPDQWFIKYSDEKWTKISQDFAVKMTIKPEEYHRDMPSVLDWFKDRACVRQGSWLGTKFPFDEKWIVEPISDSTLYPVYYIVSKYINEGSIKAELINDSFFDYVFLGKGNSRDAAKKTSCEEKTIKQIRSDFEYWYPLDMNFGGKEHKTVHFPVFLMNHTAILEKNNWPLGIFVNWWVTQPKGKISKSKGGAKPVPDVAKKYTVDGMRLYYCNFASPYTDMEWDEKVAQKYSVHVKNIWNLLGKTINATGIDNKMIDDWLTASVSKRLRNAVLLMDDYNIRDASMEIFFNSINDLKTYFNLGGENKETLRNFAEIWMKMMSPITPHLAEEFWKRMGKEGFVSVQEFPKPKKFDEKSKKLVNVFLKTKEDISNIIKMLGKRKIRKNTIFIAPFWKTKILRMSGNMETIMKTVERDNELVKYKSEIFNLVKNKGRAEVIFESGDEEKIFNESKNYLEKVFNIKVEIVNADNSSEKKAKQSLPGKPAILIN